MEVPITGSQMSKLVNFKDTMKNAELDPWVEDSRMHMKCWVAMR